VLGGRRSVAADLLAGGAHTGHYSLEAGRSDTADRGFCEDVHEFMGAHTAIEGWL
jgi:hypothetical protein